MTLVARLLLAANATSRRFLHHKASAKRYPKVNIEDVELEKPRYGFRRERPELISQTVKDTLFPSTEIKKRYLKAGKPVPIKYRYINDKIGRRNYQKYQEEVALGLPHFRVGEKQIYFPKARVCLLRPNAKHTPYQAKFLVPRNFNKMDLRDYLWHVYGLRALNVTVQLLHARFTRGNDDHARHRGPQYKKMTIDMEEPFVWPALPESLVSRGREAMEDQLPAMRLHIAVGSDKGKHTGAYDGLYDTPKLPNQFIPRRARKPLAHRADAEERAMVMRLLGM